MEKNETFWVETQNARRQIIIDFLLSHGCMAKKAWDGDIDVENPDDEKCREALELLEEGGYQITKLDGKVHIHSPFRKEFSWFQRW